MLRDSSGVDQLAKVTEHYIQYLEKEIQRELAVQISHLQSLVRRKEEILATLRNQSNDDKQYEIAEKNFKVIEGILNKSDQSAELRAWLTDGLDESKPKADQAAVNQTFNKLFQTSRQSIENSPVYAKLPQLIREHTAAIQMQDLVKQHKTRPDDTTATALQKHYEANRDKYSEGSTRSRSFSYILGHLLDKVLGRNKNNTLSMWQKPSDTFQKQAKVTFENEMLKGVNDSRKRPI